MKKRLIVHVGVPKAASTYLQTYVFPPWVYSDETLVGCAKKSFRDFERKIGKLKELYSEAEILFITREIERWKQSMYSTYLMFDGEASYNNFKKRYEGLSWEPFIKKLRLLFPKVYVLKYETLKKHPETFRKQLSSILGQEVSLPEIRVNTELTPLQKTFAKLLNRYVRPALIKLKAPAWLRKRIETRYFFLKQDMRRKII